MRRAVIHYPKDMFGGLVGFLRHDLVHQCLKRINTGRFLTTSKDLGSMNIPSCHIGYRAQSFIFKFHFHYFSRPRRCRWMNTPPCLNTGLLIRTNNEFVFPQRSTIPAAMIQVQNVPGLVLKVGISRENPAAILPGFNGVFMKPAPNSSSTNGSSNATIYCQLRYFSGRKSGQWFAKLRRQLTSQSLNLNGQLRGKKQGVYPAELHPPARPIAFQRIVFAIYLQSAGANQLFFRSHHWGDLGQQEAQFSLAPLDNKVTYIFSLHVREFVFLLLLIRLYMGFFLAYFSFLLATSPTRNMPLLLLLVNTIRHRINVIMY